MAIVRQAATGVAERDPCAVRKNVRWHWRPSAEQAAEEMAGRLANFASRCVEQTGSFRLVSAGGRSLLSLYERLAFHRCDWGRWHVYFADERCLPRNHPERNSVVLRQAWLDRVSIPHGQVYPIPTELGPDKAVAAYAAVMDSVCCPDLVMLGLGEDGHIASLFPGADWGTGATAPTVLSNLGAPKPPPARVSLSMSALNRARHIWILALGSEKREALRRWRAGQELPASALSSVGGVDVWADRLAWPDNEEGGPLTRAGLER